MTGPVFALPPPPEVWDGASLIRIVDPLGEAIAWLAPDAGGCCAGYAVRGIASGETRWRHVIGGDRADRSGIVGVGGEVDDAPWRFVERDPASCVIEWEGEGQRCRLTACLDDARLSLAVHVRNTGDGPIGMGMRLRLVLTTRPEVIVASSDGAATVAWEPVEDGSVCWIAVDVPGEVPAGDGRWLAVEIDPGR